MELPDLRKYHEDHYGPVDYEVWAPGRINLIGEHTDYNNGYVLPAAIDSGIHFLFSFDKNEDRFELYSTNLDEHRSFLRSDEPLKPDNWAKYLQALVQLLAEEDGVNVPGFLVSLTSNIPTGGGLSSSAALNAGFIRAINEHGHHDWSLKKMAELAQYTEHRIGARVGIMDPYAILVGRKDHFSLIDCRTDEYELIPADMKDHILLLIDTGISHDLADSEYNNRRESCEAVLEAVNTFEEVTYVSDLTADHLMQVRQKYPGLSTTGVEYVLEENHRVLEAVKALQQGDLTRVGSLMYGSHAGLRDQYRVSCEELDYLVALAREFGVPGARMMGGGFGGSTINLLPESKVDDFTRYVLRYYEKKYNYAHGFLRVKPSDGARLI